MSEPQLSNPRKRQRPLQPNGTSQPQSKKQKPSHPTDGSQPPAAFWNNLSKVWLTRRALRELERRNTRPALSAPCYLKRRPHRPLTRRALAEQRKNSQEPAQPATEFLSSCTPNCLKDIKLFARHGGPDISSLRGYTKATHYTLNCKMSSNQSSSRGRKRGSISTSDTKATTNTTTTKSTGPYDRAFQQNLIDGGVYPHAYEYPDGRLPIKPNNLEEIKMKLAQPRPSLSPSKFSEEAHERFVRADAHALKEKQVSEIVIPIIEGRIEDVKCRSGGIPFTNLDHLTDGTLKPGNPDLYYGARPEQLDRKVRDELNGHIIPSTQHDLPIAPNFFLAAKGPDGSLAVAGRQACYDGALGARGIQSLRSYKQGESDYDDNAYTITSIYHGGQLKMYTSHLKEPSNSEDRPEYFMTQVNTWGMTGNVETFRQGATAFRNAIGWTKEKRNEFIETANRMRSSNNQPETLTVNASSSLVSSFVTEASLDEPYTIEPLSQESRTSLNEHSNADNMHSEDSTDEFLDHRLSAKRQKRREIAKPSSGRSRNCAATSVSTTLSHEGRESSVERRVTMNELQTSSQSAGTQKRAERNSGRIKDLYRTRLT